MTPQTTTHPADEPVIACAFQLMQERAAGIERWLAVEHLRFGARELLLTDGAAITQGLQPFEFLCEAHVTGCPELNMQAGRPAAPPSAGHERENNRRCPD